MRDSTPRWWVAQSLKKEIWQEYSSIPYRKKGEKLTSMGNLQSQLTSYVFYLILKTPWQRYSLHVGKWGTKRSHGAGRTRFCVFWSRRWWCLHTLWSEGHGDLTWTVWFYRQSSEAPLAACSGPAEHRLCVPFSSHLLLVLTLLVWWPFPKQLMNPVQSGNILPITLSPLWHFELF